MHKRIVLAAALLPLLLAAGPDQPDTITGSLVKEGGDLSAIAPALGHRGVLFIRSQARWDQLAKLLPDLTPAQPLPQFDFSKQSLIMVYANPCRAGESFSLEKSDLAAKPPRFHFLFHWDNSPMEQDDHKTTRFILAPIPIAEKVSVGISSIPAHGKDFAAEAELTATLGDKEGGDIVDGLQASITAKAATIKPGEDILIDFALNAPKLPAAKDPHFNQAHGSVFVWDGKYSNGYRNHAFFVTTPDGKTALLQPKVQNDWDKNAPHLVEITADKPYHLPNWSGDDTFKSLKELGLDTTAPGVYTITGVYQEVNDGMDPAAVMKRSTACWAGSIASNTITVEVAK